MHSLLYFNSTLSDNEISQFALVPPLVHVQPDCRCPPSHPITRENTCETPSGSSQVSRVNNNTHHPSLLNDGNLATWWQSETGVVPVNITVSLGGLRAALTVGIRFRSVQPQAMVLYYSSDNGITFMARQYYSTDCARFNLPNNGLLRTAVDVNCITTQSAPRANQDVTFRVLDVGNRPEADDYVRSADLQAFSLATHIRMELVEWNSVVASEQYFAIDEVIVGGQECVCNGHADTCIGSTCLCQHNTAGTNCEVCLPFFNNEPWAPGTLSTANQCEACQCNNHTTLCAYNEAAGTGVCVDCQDNTQGDQCQLCQPLFYNPQGVALNDPMACQLCDCNLPGVQDGNVGNCSALGPSSGQCDCKEFVTGRRCDQCLNGYYNLTASNSNGCISCDCHVTGTVDGSTACDMISGQCLCKANVIGRDCSSCAAGHYGIENAGGCFPCDLQCDECTGPGATNCVVSSCHSNIKVVV